MSLMVVEGKVLNKSGKLTETKVKQMQEHPVIGHKISRKIPLFTSISTIVLYHLAKENGATIIGKVGVSDYDFNHSEAVIDDQFVGLPLDNNNQGELTEIRIKEWLEELINKIQ